MSQRLPSARPRLTPPARLGSSLLAAVSLLAIVLVCFVGCSARSRTSKSERASPKASSKSAAARGQPSRPSSPKAGGGAPQNKNPGSKPSAAGGGAQALASESDTALAHRFAGQIIRHGARNMKRKAICLTFDDGPLPPYTNQILDILKKEDVKATFFMLGYNAQRFPEVARRVLAEGHAIGNHTYNHARAKTPDKAAWQVDRGAEAIQQATGVRPFIFRPPGGDLKSLVTAYATSKGYPIIMWTISSADTTNRPVELLISNVIHTPWPGDIVLMHDGGCPHPRTVAALPKIIEETKKQGCIFLTLPQLLNELAAWEDEGNPREPSKKPKPAVPAKPKVAHPLRGR